MAGSSVQLVGHLDLRAGISRWGFRFTGKAFSPALMMGFTPRRNVGLDLALLQGCDVLLAPEAVIQGRRRRRTEFQGQGGQGGFNFGFVISMVGPA
jgi:hypothetical protein